jgi:pimeloyl-ACP methyl ester carboxylesterase
MHKQIAAGGFVLSILALWPVASDGQTTTVTRDIAFTSHDGHAMTGRLTLPDTPGTHPVMVFVQNAEAATLDQRTRNAAGQPVAFFDLYRETLAPLNIGFFSYEGRGVQTDETAPGRMKLDAAVYNTSTLENKVRDIMSAVQLLQKQPGVDSSQIFLRGVSEGTLLAAEAASRMPREVKGIVLSGVIGTTLKDSLKHMVRGGRMLQLLDEFDTDRDQRISPQEFEADTRGFRKKNLPTTTFEQVDADKSGFITVDDIAALTKPLADAFDAGNVEITEAFLKQTAAVPIPPGWVKDHFTHGAMWTFIAPLTMPVGIFQGEVDRNTPASDVRVLEGLAKKAGKTNLEFYYFDGLGHGLGSTDYFQKGAHSAGYAAIFDFMKRHTR